MASGTVSRTRRTRFSAEQVARFLSSYFSSDDDRDELFTSVQLRRETDSQEDFVSNTESSGEEENIKSTVSVVGETSTTLFPLLKHGKRSERQVTGID